MKFTVERARWIRGEGNAVSRLRRADDGRMCCLGFFALAAGLTEEQITGHGSPGTLSGHLGRGSLPADVAFLVEDRDVPCSTDLCCRIMGLNDAENGYGRDGCLVRVNDPEKEADLKRSFASIGHEVEFV